MRNIFITSQPKAGTYLMASIMREIGYKPSNIHIHRNLDQAWKYSGDAEVDRNTPPQNVAYGIQPGYIASLGDMFAVGHLPKNANTLKELDGLKKIICLRPLNDCLLSMYRWRMKSNRHYNRAYAAVQMGAEGFRTYLLGDAKMDADNWRQMFNWQEADGIVVWFEDMVKGNLDFLKFKAFLELPHSRDEFFAAVKRGINADTQTKIPKDDIEYWTPENMEIYKKLKYD